MTMLGQVRLARRATLGDAAAHAPLAKAPPQQQRPQDDDRALQGPHTPPRESYEATNAPSPGRRRDAYAGGPVRGSRSPVKAQEPYPMPPRAALAPRPASPPAPEPPPLCETDVQTLSACDFVTWVLAHGLDATHRPTATLRAIARVWLQLSDHCEGGKTLVLEKRGKVLHAAAHTPKQAWDWHEAAVAPPEHHALLGTIEERLRALGDLPVLRALRLPWLRERDNVVCGGTRFVRDGTGAYEVQSSKMYGFAPSEEALDMIATFHAYLCCAADIQTEIFAPGPLQILAARINIKQQALKAAAQ